MKDPNERVTVKIWASERISYSLEVEMTRSEFERLDTALEDAGVDESAAESIIDCYIDRTIDAIDDSEYEVTTFEIVNDSDDEDDDDLVDLGSTPLGI